MLNTIDDHKHEKTKKTWEDLQNKISYVIRRLDFLSYIKLHGHWPELVKEFQAIEDSLLQNIRVENDVDKIRRIQGQLIFIARMRDMEQYYKNRLRELQENINKIESHDNTTS